MPEIDTDLFQLLALALLFIGVLALLGVLAALGRIRKLLEDSLSQARLPSAEAPAGAPAGTEEPQEEPGQPAAAAAGAPEPEDVGAATGAEAAVGGAAATAEAAGARPAARRPEAETQPAQEPAAREQPAPAAEAEAAAPPITPQEQEPARQPEPAEHPFMRPDEGAAAAEATPGSAETAERAAVQTTAAGAEPGAQEPQEQPFERDGRWYFRRDGELLVYEESTGEWVPASQPAPEGGAIAPAPQAAEAPTAQEPAVGGFWKCASCGAVNGSTATTCRMCFTPRS
jgi:hypothetical protein